MKYLIFILFSLNVSNCYSQNSPIDSSYNVSIDSVIGKRPYKIECFESGCVIHTKSIIIIRKVNSEFFASLNERTDTAGGSQTFIINKFCKLSKDKIDSIRQFEKDLTIFPSDFSDGQHSMYYTLIYGKHRKMYFDGRMNDNEWMGFYGLVKTLFNIEKE